MARSNMPFPMDRVDMSVFLLTASLSNLQCKWRSPYTQGCLSSSLSRKRDRSDGDFYAPTADNLKQSSPPLLSALLM